jgi:hypothetical protein
MKAIMQPSKAGSYNGQSACLPKRGPKQGDTTNTQSFTPFFFFSILFLAL